MESFREEQSAIDWIVKLGDEVTVNYNGRSFRGRIDKGYTLGNFRLRMADGSAMTFDPNTCESIVKER
jgi:hypothetical protein